MCIVEYHKTGRAVQMSNKTWLTDRKVDASKKIFFVATKIVVFDFELFIGEHRQLVSVFNSQHAEICAQIHCTQQWTAWAYRRYLMTILCSLLSGHGGDRPSRRPCN